MADLRYPLPQHPQSYEWDEAAGTFSSRGQEPVLDWYSSLGSDTEVCAVRFTDSARVDYRLRTFPDVESAVAEGHVVTHRRHAARVRRYGISRSTWRSRISPRPRGRARDG